MNMTSADIDLELIFLEDWADSPHCEAWHDEKSAPCSYTPVAKKFACDRTAGFLICQSSVDWNIYYMAIGGRCDRCLRPATECFRIQSL